MQAARINAPRSALFVADYAARGRQGVGESDRAAQDNSATLLDVARERSERPSARPGRLIKRNISFQMYSRASALFYAYWNLYDYLSSNVLFQTRFFPVTVARKVYPSCYCIGIRT